MEEAANEGRGIESDDDENEEGYEDELEGELHEDDVEGTPEDEFSRWCSSVRANDPTVTYLRTPTMYSRGYGRRLGDALQGNTHVERISILLDPHRIDTPPDEEVEDDNGDFTNGAENEAHERDNSNRNTSLLQMKGTLALCWGLCAGKPPLSDNSTTDFDVCVFRATR